MNILVVTSKPTTRDIRVRQTVRWLRELGFHATELCPSSTLKQHQSQLWQLGLSRPEVDVVWCNDLDTVLYGLLMKLKWGTRVIYDAHDIYLYQLQRGKQILFWPYFWLLERLASRFVDVVVVASEGFRKYFRGFRKIERIENVKGHPYTCRD